MMHACAWVSWVFPCASSPCAHCAAVTVHTRAIDARPLAREVDFLCLCGLRRTAVFSGVYQVGDVSRYYVEV